MKHIELYALKPANRIASKVVAQSKTEHNEVLTKQELVELSNRLLRKQRLMKLFLGVKTRAQHKNLINNYIRGQHNHRIKKEPRLVAEYKRVGEAISILDAELARQRAERRKESEALEAVARERAASRKAKV